MNPNATTFTMPYENVHCSLQENEHDLITIESVSVESLSSLNELPMPHFLSFNSNREVVKESDMPPTPSVHDFSSFTNTIGYEEIRKVFDSSYDENFDFLGFESEGTTVTEGKG